LALEQTLALERLEFVDYFSKLSEQLNELSLKATGMAITRQQAHKKRNLLDTTISEQITDLQQQTHAASNLEQLKQSLNSQLVKVFENIELSKMQADLERSSMELELQALSSEIGSIKQESTTLKSRLEQLQSQPNAALVINDASELPFTQRLTLEISRSKRNGLAITVMAIAIDHYLELFSHNALNKMVDIIEQFLRKNCRQSDFMTRESDDGFVMVLPGTDSNGAKALVAKLQTALDKALVKANGSQLTISLSFGISQVLLDDPKLQVIERAKTALTVAQQKGSNQYSIG
jgi:diguanylate cyclase